MQAGWFASCSCYSIGKNACTAVPMATLQVRELPMCGSYSSAVPSPNVNVPDCSHMNWWALCFRKPFLERSCGLEIEPCFALWSHLKRPGEVPGLTHHKIFSEMHMWTSSLGLQVMGVTLEKLLSAPKLSPGWVATLQDCGACLMDC